MKPNEIRRLIRRFADESRDFSKTVYAAADGNLIYTNGRFIAASGNSFPAAAEPENKTVALLWSGLEKLIKQKHDDQPALYSVTFPEHAFNYIKCFVKEKSENIRLTVEPSRMVIHGKYTHSDFYVVLDQKNDIPKNISFSYEMLCVGKPQTLVRYLEKGGFCADNFIIAPMVGDESEAPRW